MSHSLFPRLYVDGLFDVPLEELQFLGINCLIFDLDNTITTWNSNCIHEEIIQWFLVLRQTGFRAIILSNNHAPRIEGVAQQLDIPYVERARKPRAGAYYKAMESLNATVETTAVIGDQLFTDILGGNRMGLLTILVRPLGWKEFPGTKLSRIAEKPVLWRLYRRRERGRIY